MINALTAGQVGYNFFIAVKNSVAYKAGVFVIVSHFLLTLTNYNNKTCCHNGVRFLSNLLIESQKYK